MRHYIGIIFAMFLCSTTCGATIQCPKILHIGDEEICLSPFKQSNPSLAVQINDTIYFATTSPEPKGKLKIEYMGKTYSVYNYEYELIHWLSGEDALINGIWHDRMEYTTTDKQPLNFMAVGNIIHTADNGYYSENGMNAYFQTQNIPDINFGSDWYIEMTFNLQIAEPEINDNAYFIDFSYPGPFLSACIVTPLASTTQTGHISGNLRAKTGREIFPITKETYSNGGKIIYKLGIRKYDDTQSQAFAAINNNYSYGPIFETQQFPYTQPTTAFYLFRLQPVNQFEQVSVTGTIYDIKIYRKK